MRLEYTFGQEFPIISYAFALRRHLRSPGRRGAARFTPFLSRAVQIEQLPGDSRQPVGARAEILLHSRTEDESGKQLAAFFPQRLRIIWNLDSIAVSIAYAVCVPGTRELVDLFGRLPESFVGEQLLEVDRQSVTVPGRGRRKSDGYAIVDSAQHQRLPVSVRQFQFLAAEKPVPHIPADVVKKWVLGSHSHEEQGFFPVRPLQVDAGIVVRIIGQTLRIGRALGGPQVACTTLLLTRWLMPTATSLSQVAIE